MAKSARASVVKKNKAHLKKRVFGPVEDARVERLHSKLLALASQPKPPSEEMEVEQDDAKGTEMSPAADQTMDVDRSEGPPPPRSERNAKQKRQKAARIQKSHRKRKPKNQIVFPKTGLAKKRSQR